MMGIDVLPNDRATYRGWIEPIAWISHSDQDSLRLCAANAYADSMLGIRFTAVKDCVCKCFTQSQVDFKLVAYRATKLIDHSHYLANHGFNGCNTRLNRSLKAEGEIICQKVAARKTLVRHN